MSEEIICPYCVRPLHQCLPDGSCPLPHDFEKKCQSARPLWISSAGFTQHGKTVFLSALTMLLDQLADVLPDFTCDYLDQYTLDSIREMRWQAKNGKLSDSTQLQKPQPLLIRIQGTFEPGALPIKRTLVVYDAAGEFFSSLEHLSEHLPSIQHVQTIWFLVSLTDMRASDETVSMTDLFQSYRAAMESSGINPKGRKVIVVFTKSELLRKDLPESVRAYLSKDPFQKLCTGAFQQQPPFTLQGYLAKAREVSDELEEFAKQQPGGRQFINMVRNEGMQLRFVATSALGHNPNQHSNTLIEDATRYRVLDPLLWTLGETTLPESTTTSQQKLILVVDSGETCDPLYASGSIQKLWEALSKRGETTTYYLGGSRPTSLAQQPPPSQPANRKRIRVIGSILDRAPSDCRVLVLTTNTIMDLNDYVTSEFTDRLLIGVTDEDFEDIWPNTFILRENTDADQIVHQLLNLSSGH